MEKRGARLQGPRNSEICARGNSAEANSFALRYWTVSETVVECVSDPDVPVMVIV